MLETGTPPNAKEEHLSQGSRLPGEKGNLTGSQSWHRFWWIYGEIAGNCALGCPWGREIYNLFCFVFIIKAPHEPQKYHTRTPACKNKDPDGTNESTCLLASPGQDRDLPPQHLWREWRNIHTNTGCFRCPLIAQKNLVFHQLSK